MTAKTGLHPDIYDNIDETDPFWNMLQDEVEEQAEPDTGHIVFCGIEEPLERRILHTVVRQLSLALFDDFDLIDDEEMF